MAVMFSRPRKSISKPLVSKCELWGGGDYLNVQVSTEKFRDIDNLKDTKQAEITAIPDSNNENLHDSLEQNTIKL